MCLQIKPSPHVRPSAKGWLPRLQILIAARKHRAKSDREPQPPFQIRGLSSRGKTRETPATRKRKNVFQCVRPSDGLAMPKKTFGRRQSYGGSTRAPAVSKLEKPAGW